MLINPLIIMKEIKAATMRKPYCTEHVNTFIGNTLSLFKFSLLSDITF